MAYEKQTWQTGEVITQEKLNHMEDGIGSCVMVVGATTGENNAVTLGKTWQEIHDAMASGKIVATLESYEGGVGMHLLMSADSVNSTYRVIDEALKLYTASSADGYPASSGES